MLLSSALSALQVENSYPHPLNLFSGQCPVRYIESLDTDYAVEDEQGTAY